MARLFEMTTEQIINYDGKIPTEVVLEDQKAAEQNEAYSATRRATASKINLIASISKKARGNTSKDYEEKGTLLKLIETFVYKNG